jgi:hypothetical protein
VENTQTSLDQSFRSIGVVRCQAVQSRHYFVDPRVVLHGAGPQRIQARVHSIIPRGKAREVADYFQLRDLRKALDFAPSELRAQPFFHRYWGHVEWGEVHPGFSRCAPLENQLFVSVDVRPRLTDTIFHVIM